MGRYESILEKETGIKASALDSGVNVFRQPKDTFYQTSLPSSLPRSRTSVIAPTEAHGSNAEMEAPITNAGTEAPSTNADDDFKIIGECLSTYIIVEKDDQIILIDKHAAHERMIFDRLTSEDVPIMAQLTLTPVVCDMSPDDIAVIDEYSSLLSESGFEIDRFSDRSVAVRQLPADIDTGEVKPLLEEMCEKLRNGDSSHLTEMRHEVLHSVACKAAIKAGRESHPAEFYDIVRQVLGGDVKYCPHGRPVSVVITKNELDKKFRRI